MYFTKGAFGTAAAKGAFSEGAFSEGAYGAGAYGRCAAFPQYMYMKVSYRDLIPRNEGHAHIK